MNSTTASFANSTTTGIANSTTAVYGSTTARTSVKLKWIKIQTGLLFQAGLSKVQTTQDVPS